MQHAKHRVTVAVNGFVILGLVVTTIMGIVTMFETQHAVEQLSKTKDLASELRQSSDDLTRFVRTYTVTGNLSYVAFYNQTVAIRNGTSPLPHEPARNFWDLYIRDGRAPRGFDPPRSLLDRVRAAGFTAEEVAKMDLAKALSDALIRIEELAMAYVTGNATLVRNQTRAMLLTHNAVYHQLKGNIMEPLDDFEALSTSRVVHKISDLNDVSVIVVSLNGAMLVVLVGAFVFYTCHVSGESQTEHLLSSVLPERVARRIHAGAAATKAQERNRAVADNEKRRRDESSTDNGAAGGAADDAGAKPVDDGTLSRSAYGASSELTALPGHGRSAKLVAHERHLSEHNGATATAGPQGGRTGDHGTGAAAAPRVGAFPVLYTEYYPAAWVAFTDVVGFTKICRYTNPDIVVSILNELFENIRALAKERGRVEVVRTVGDAVLLLALPRSDDEGLSVLAPVRAAVERVAAGTDRRAADAAHADAVARAGVSLAEFLVACHHVARRVKRTALPGSLDSDPDQPRSALPTYLRSLNDADDQPPLELRSGLHVGPVTAGVVGFGHPQYDLLGDTLNTAAALEREGDAGHIHVLESTFAAFGVHTKRVQKGRAKRVAFPTLGTATTRLISHVAPEKSTSAPPSAAS